MCTYLLCVSLLFGCFVATSQGQEVETIPPTTTDQPIVYVAAEKGQTNVLLQCFQYSNAAQEQQQITAWGVRRDSIDPTVENLVFNFDESLSSPSDLADDIVVTGKTISSFSLRTNLTILNFTNQFDTTTVECGTDTRTFILGFPVAPSVRDDVEIQSVTEDNTITINMTSLSISSTPFPPQLSFKWTFDGQIVPNTSIITINDYLITFINVQRNNTGNYTLKVSNTARVATGSFKLDVQFPPEAIPISSEPLIVLNNTHTVTLLALTSIIGNPYPNITWTGPDGQVITNSNKYNTSTGIPGQLIITSVVTIDNGTYTCTVSNGIGQSLTESVDLIIADGAGPPMSVVTSDITDTSVTINWSPPDYLGVPQLSYYQLTLIPAPFPSMDHITSNTTTLVVNDLLPNTVYNISIVGVSTGNSFDILLGDQSSIVTITTLTGAPLISDINGTSINGSILISWSLVHTGGLPIDQYYLYCNGDSPQGVVDDRISKILLCRLNECSEDELSGSSVLGPVMIGTVYTCSISVINNEGIDSKQINNITVHEQGLPSVPVVLSSTVTNILSLITSVTYAGNIDGSFRLIVDIYQQITMDEQSSYYNRYIYNYPMYNDRDNITVNISGLNPGIYTLVITSSNRFGESVDKVTVQVKIESRGISHTSTVALSSSCNTLLTTIQLPCTSSSVIPDTVVSNTDSIVIGSSVGIVIIFIIAIVELVILILAIIFCRRRRGGKGSINNLSGVPRPPPVYDEVELKSTRSTTNRSSLQVDNSDINVRTNEAYGELKSVYM